MTQSQNLNTTINRVAFWTAIILLVSGVLSLFFPLDAPAGPFADRMMWYSTNLGAFVVGWTIQMIAMLTLSGVFAAIAWHTRVTHPLSAFLAGVALLMSLMAFLIPKFIAIWSIPQMVTASASVTADAAIAEQLFQLLHPSLSFSLFTSFDYLGFWMYGLFSLLVALPLFRLGLSGKIAGAGFGAFGILYHIFVFAVMTRSLEGVAIGSFAEGMFLILLVPVVAMIFYFRTEMKKA